MIVVFHVVGYIALIFGLCLIIAGYLTFVKKRDDDVDDDLGYLEHIVNDLGGDLSEE